jgi:glycine cleavage system H protein
MSDVPDNLLYTDGHQWVRTLPDGTIEIGITDHAQQALGDIVSVELPDVGGMLKSEEGGAVVESTKTTSDVNSPVPAVVTATNTKVVSEPQTVNTDPYGSWLMRVRPAPGALASAKLLNAAEYRKLLEAEGD